MIEGRERIEVRRHAGRGGTDLLSLNCVSFWLVHRFPPCAASDRLLTNLSLLNL
jgi:hypothetical protein